MKSAIPRENLLSNRKQPPQLYRVLVTRMVALCVVESMVKDEIRNVVSDDVDQLRLSSADDKISYNRLLSSQSLTRPL
jgi:hypothetical protein